MPAADKDVICFCSTLLTKRSYISFFFAIHLYSTSLPEGPECCGKIIYKVRFGDNKMRPKRRERIKKDKFEWNKKSVG
jgi:hypothetical protein